MRPNSAVVESFPLAATAMHGPVEALGTLNVTSDVNMGIALKQPRIVVTVARPQPAGETENLDITYQISYSRLKYAIEADALEDLRAV